MNKRLYVRESICREEFLSVNCDKLRDLFFQRCEEYFPSYDISIDEDTYKLEELGSSYRGARVRQSAWVYLD